MVKTINMQLMRYINVFGKISKISTSDCFVYNNTIYFVVPKYKVRSAIGKNAENIKKISSILGKKIRVVAFPDEKIDEIDALKKFIADVVSPIEFDSLEMKDGVLVLSGGREAKAILIGRNRSREEELAEVLKKNFGIKEFKIV